MVNVNVPRLRTLLFERGLSPNALAQQAKINPLTAQRVMRNGAVVRLKTIGNLARFFGVDGNELIAVAQKEGVSA